MTEFLGAGDSVIKLPGGWTVREAHVTIMNGKLYQWGALSME